MADEDGALMPAGWDAGNGGRRLLLLAAALLLGATTGYASQQYQLGTRIARFYRAGMAERVFAVFVALSVAQGAVAEPSIAVAGVVAAAATWAYLRVRGGQTQKVIQP